MTTTNTKTDTNTASPASKTEAQTPPAFPAFPHFNFGAAMDPMAMWTNAQQAWTKLMADAIARSQSFADQYVALESQLMTRTHDAINTWAQLSHDALTYSTQLSTEARKMSFDAARKMGVSA